MMTYSRKTFRALITSDLHFTSSPQPCYPVSFADDTYSVLAMIKEKAAAESIDTVIFCGDQINGAPPDAVLLSDIFRDWKKEGITLLALCGNHDLSRMTPAEYMRVYDGLFSYCARDSSSLSFTYSAEDLLLIFADDSSHGKHGGGEITPETMSWIEEQLMKASSQRQKVIFFSHHALAGDPWMPDTAFYTVQNPGLLPLLQRCGVRLAFSGHQHCSLIRNRGELTECVVPMPSAYPHRIGIFEVCGSAAHYHTEQLPVPARLRAKDEAFLKERKARYLRLPGNPETADAACAWQEAFENETLHDSGLMGSDAYRRLIEQLADTVTGRWMNFVTDIRSLQKPLTVSL